MIGGVLYQLYLKTASSDLGLANILYFEHESNHLLFRFDSVGDFGICNFRARDYNSIFAPKVIIQRRTHDGKLLLCDSVILVYFCFIFMAVANYT